MNEVLALAARLNVLLATLTNQQRMSVLYIINECYCQSCGDKQSERYPCQCQNDE